MKDYRQPLNLPKSIVMDENILKLSSIGIYRHDCPGENGLPFIYNWLMFEGQNIPEFFKLLHFYYGLN